MEDHPIQITFGDDRTRSRLTCFFRGILIVPHSLWLSIYSIGAIVIAGLNWFATLFAGKSPEGFHTFLASWIAYVARVQAYAMFLVDSWPPFNGEDEYAVNVSIAPPAPQGRLGVFFRPMLMIPAGVVLIVLAVGLYVTTALGLLCIIVVGRMPDAFQRYGEYVLRYAIRARAYADLLTSAYPNTSVPGE